MESKVPPQAEDNAGQDQPNTIVIQLVTIPYNCDRQNMPYSVQAIPLYVGPTDPQAGPPQRGVPDRTRIPAAPDMAAPPKQSAQNPNRSPRNCCNQCRGQNYSQAPLPSFIPPRSYPMTPGPRPGVRRYPTDDSYNEARLPRRCFCQCSCQRNIVPQQEVFEEQAETLTNSHRERTPVAEPGDEGYRDQGTNTTEAGAAGSELPNLAALKVICESLGKAMVAAAAVAVEAAQKKTMGIDTDKSNDQSNLSEPKLKASFHNRLIHDYIPSDPGDAESIDIPEIAPEDIRAVDDEKLINVENQNNNDSMDENKDPNEANEKIKSEDEAVGEETSSIRYLDEPVVHESKVDEEVLSVVSREYPKTPRPTYLFQNTDDIDSGNNSPASSPTRNENQANNEVPEVSPSNPEKNNFPLVQEKPKAPSEAAKIVHPLSISRIIEDNHPDGSPRHLHLATDSHSDHAKTKLYPIQRSHESSMEHFVDPSESERSVQVERIAPLKFLKTNNDSTVSLFNKTNSKVDDSGQESSQDEENEEKSRIASGSSTIHDKKRKLDASSPYSEDLPGNSSPNKVSSGKSLSARSSLKKSFSKKAPKKSVSFANCCVDKPSSTGKQKCRHFSSKAKRKAATNASPICRSSGPASWVSPAGFPTSQISCHTFQYTKANSSQQPTPEDQTYSVQHQFKSVDPNM